MTAIGPCVLLSAALWGMPEAAWAANVAPVANDQETTLVEGSTKVGLYLSVTDPDSSPPFTYRLVRGPANGKLATSSGALSDGSATTSRAWYYTPDSGFSGTDSFTWKVSDGLAESNSATYTLIVKPNTVPIAKDYKRIMLQGESRLSVPLVYTDPDGQAMTFTIVTVPAQGILERYDNGTYVKLTAGSTMVKNQVAYTPKLEFSGEDSFTWKVSDGLADSNVATGTIMVERNTPPAINPSLSLTFLKNSANEYDLQPFLKFIDPNFKQSHTFTLVRVPSRGLIKAGGTTLTAGSSTANPAWVYTLNQNGADIDNFAWSVSDGVDSSTKGEVRIEVVATPPGNPDTPPAFKAGIRIMKGTEPLRVSGNNVYGNTGTLGCAAPEVADWNNDGLADLLVGQRDGRVSLYLNKGTKGNPVFNGYSYLKMTDGTHIHKEGFRCACFGGRWVNSTPRVVDWNNDGKKDLAVGVWGGDGTDFGTSGYQQALGIVVYLNVGTDAAPVFENVYVKRKKFVLLSTLPKTGWATAGRPSAMPFVTDLNGDGFLDIVSGENNVWFKRDARRGKKGAPSGLINIFLGAWKNMDQGYVQDVFYHNGLGASVWPIMTLAGACPVGSRKSVIAVDWNGDGRKDLVVGMQDGSVWYSPNVGTPTLPVYKNHYPMKAGGADMVVGDPNKLGTDPGYNDFGDTLHLTTLSWKSPDMMSHANEARLGAGDLDGDGLTDLVAGDASGYVWFFRQVNTGVNQPPVYESAPWANPNPVRLLSTP